ncbi:hypothetical protein MERGE_000265 [Pneumocystis wakefieldiae]|uniref:non-specific serine/threonine protein kinase n=1 Tax=Pneumocystis wakefieldiae TaxID=38082 RepID=A0A899FJ84_9ASCO|nr:hypothetical protein MERGE_000265 [Pneumocystis wakefieldiae]
MESSEGVNDSDYDLLDVIGHGSFGLIRKVRRRSDGMVFARKEIHYRKMEERERKQLASEVHILSNLRHPHIVRYFGRSIDRANHTIHLYMEFCGNGDLGSLIKECQQENSIIPENILWSIFVQLTLALYRCHFGMDAPSSDILVSSPPSPPSSVVVLHRDIKPDNIFRDGEIYVKLGDFGLSRILDDPSRTFAQTYVGTPYYMSPEIINHEPYTAKSDIWALGCTMYEMCTKLPPFRAMTQPELNHKIRRGIFPPIPGLYSMTLRDTIRWCLAVDPKRRPMASDLLMIDMFRAYRKELEILEFRKELKVRENNLLKREASVLAKEEELKNKERILYEKEINLGKAIQAHVCRSQTEIDRLYSKTQELGHSGERTASRPSIISSTHTIASLHCTSSKDKRHVTIDNNLSKLSPTRFSPGERRQITISSIPIRQPLQENTSKLSNTSSNKTPVTPSRLRVSPSHSKTLDSPLHSQGILRTEINTEITGNLRNPRPTVMEMWKKNVWEDGDELPSPFLRKNVTISN